MFWFGDWDYLVVQGPKVDLEFKVSLVPEVMPACPEGDRGQRGPVAPQGLVGKAGSKGERGPMGVPGAQGLSGTKGDKAPRMSGAQFGDPQELCPVTLGEAPFRIRLCDSHPDGRPSVQEEMLNQILKGLNFFRCQIGSDRRCAARTGHGKPIGPDHSLEFRRHKSSVPGNKCDQSGDS
ncbi:collagen alpha-2(I) chain-like [Entelurus aequoreus]|uniref:collagen alpha-2(I) chain-like n=1 Tax=Entelurus aequoreus TaxID=161455 RepID=UPI002B1E07C6|nr:collagen alpha-2(I) chain-like [Entelurus aequoreus]XP_061896273.1 collagen alpha-2(I) chain-like [Entelurus aequoreus]